MNVTGALNPTIRYRYWASPRPGLTLAELAEQMGDRVLEIDQPNNQLLVADYNEILQDQWGCRFCLEDLRVVILDSEDELMAHCHNDHAERM